jgi:hypothetical protein
MHDHVLIYLIVALNALCQLMLIWRQKLAAGEKWKYCSLAVAIPVVIMVSMRLMIASGTIHGRIAEQSLVEQFVTKGAGTLLIAGPWLVTVAVLLSKMRSRALLKKHATN